MVVMEFVKGGGVVVGIVAGVVAGGVVGEEGPDP